MTVKGSFSLACQPFLNPATIELPLPPLAAAWNNAALGDFAATHHLGDPRRRAAQLGSQVGRANYVGRCGIEVVGQPFEVCLHLCQDSLRLWPKFHHHGNGATAMRTRRLPEDQGRSVDGVQGFWAKGFIVSVLKSKF